MKLSRSTLIFVPAALSLLLLGLSACEDPAADKAKATVSSAAPAATSAAPKATTAMTAAPTSKPAAGDSLPIDAAASTIGFVGSKAVGKHEGKFTKFSGALTLAGGKAEGGKVNVEIDLDSVKSDDEKLDTHLKAPDFFDVAKFPKATFTSTEIKTGGEKGATHTVTGEFELRGSKKTISFPATITAGAEETTATAEFSINRKDFGIVYAGMKDNLIRDEVLIKLALKARKAK